MSSLPFVRPTSPLDRRTLGKYELLCRLSTGGMSEIFLAHQKGLAGFKKIVVLKSILPDIRGEEDFVKMFLDEARITAAFNHPNVAQVFDLDTSDGMLFLAMEFVQGCTLVEMARACRAAKEPIPIGFTLMAVRDTALALHYAHNFTDPRGRKQVVIHRDVAEKNIMVTYDGVTKLLDFGIAKALGKRTQAMTSIGMVKGTSGYMSPEQIRGEPLDQRSDIFSLGVVLHECLTGMRLFHGKSAEEGMLAALREDAPPPSRQNPEVHRALDDVTLRALSRDREARFTTALEFARELERACPGQIWHPEESGEVVQRHFTDRRRQTRELIEDAQGGADMTGEVHLDRVMAAVSHARLEPVSSTPRIDVPLDPRRPPPGPPPEEETVRKAMAGPPVTQPPSRRDSRPTLPPEPRIVTEPNAAAAQETTNTGTVNLTPNDAFYDDDDDVGAKTIPAAALPEELLKLQRAKAATKPNRSVTPPARPSVSPPQRTPPRPPVPSWPASPGRKPTGETVSLNGENYDEEDDDVGVKTTLSRPFEVLPSKPLRAEDLFDETPAKAQEVPLDSVTGSVSVPVRTADLEDEDDGGDSLDAEPVTSAGHVGGGGRKVFAVLGVLTLLAALGVAGFALKLGPFAGKTVEGPPPAEPLPLRPADDRPDKHKAEVKKEEPKKEEAKKEEAKPLVKPPEPPPPPAEEKEKDKVAEAKPEEPKKDEVAKKDPPPPKKQPGRSHGKSHRAAKAADDTDDTPPPPKEVVLADVSLVVDPPVTVLWNGKELGNTPLKAKLPVGKQSLKLVGPSGPPKSITVDVKESGTALRYDLNDL